MKNKRSIIAIIPARGGSKGIPYKNIKLLNGKPLIYYTINEAQKSKYIQRLFVSTEDDTIAEVAKRYGAEVITRPIELAQDDTPSLPVYQQVIKHLEKTGIIYPDIVVVLQPTSPLRIVTDIDSAIDMFLKSKCDSVVSVCKVEYPIEWMYRLQNDRPEPLLESLNRTIRKNDAIKVYRLNGAVYVATRDTIMNQNTVMGKDTRVYIMPLQRSVDIDTEFDFKLAEELFESYCFNNHQYS